MKNLAVLCICLFCVSCASEPAPSAADQQAISVKAQTSNLETLKLGMSREEVDAILGEATSVTETANGTTAIWVFDPGATKATPPESKSNSGFFSKIGSIVATTVGIFSPIAGVATSIGSQVYNASNAGDESTPQPAQTGTENTRIVTIEFKDNKAFSIQRAKPSSLTAPASR
ncbi:MAG: hypothetical protein ABL903_11375 [Methylococcales bacterium]